MNRLSSRSRAVSGDTAASGVESMDGKDLLEGGQPVVFDDETAASRQRMLMLSFLSMVVIGLFNKIFQKLETIPMRNYPNFLNLLTTFM